MGAASAGLRLALCSATGVARSASARHELAAGSAAALAQGLTAALLLAGHQGTRVDVQLECNGPLRGLLVDADESGAVRGLVRAKDLEGGPRSEDPTRFDGRPLFASRHDERAGAALASGAGGGQLADAPARVLDLGPLRTVATSEPRSACRCSRERVVRALRSLGARQLREMAEKDGGARLTCDFCNTAYTFSAADLVALVQP